MCNQWRTYAFMDVDLFQLIKTCGFIGSGYIGLFIDLFADYA
jgi:hypothetical protein